MDKSNQEISYLTVGSNDLEEKIHSLIDEKTKIDEEVLTLKDLLSAKKSEHDRDIRSKEKLESTVKQSNETITKKDADILAKTQEIKSMREQIIRIEASSREDRIKAEKIEKETEHLNTRIIRIQQEYEEQTQNILRLMNENSKYVDEIRSWEDEMGKQKDEFKIISRARDSLTKRLKVIEEAKGAAEIERDTLKVSLTI